MIRALIAACLLAAVAPTAGAQTRQSHCIALAEAAPGLGYLHRAAFGEPLARDTVRLSYVAHASFVLETPAGATLATDYTGMLGQGDFVPDAVTMNIAHSTHWTPVPDPRIAHVLPGWDVAGDPARHHVVVGDMLVRNIPTDIRSGIDGRRENGNSIFVFEVAGLCIGHLGHLHHEPSEAQYAALGRLDVVMAPVDGGYTLDRATLVRMLTRLRASVVIPMHWFGEANLRDFLRAMSADFEIEETGASFTEVSARDLPRRPTVRVLRPRWLDAE